MFHADRHPTESNFQLTLSGFATNRSNCQAHCGDGVVTGAEECDCGDATATTRPMECGGQPNADATYGGCTTMCKIGPFCGDGIMNGTEECDWSRTNGRLTVSTTAAPRAAPTALLRRHPWSTPPTARSATRAPP